MKFLAMGYNGINTRELGSADTREGAEAIIEQEKRDQVRSQGMVYWPMFWVHEESETTPVERQKGT